MPIFVKYKFEPRPDGRGPSPPPVGRKVGSVQPGWEAARSFPKLPKVSRSPPPLPVALRCCSAGARKGAGRKFAKFRIPNNPPPKKPQSKTPPSPFCDTFFFSHTRFTLLPRKRVYGTNFFFDFFFKFFFKKKKKKKNAVAVVPAPAPAPAPRLCGSAGLRV